MKIPRIRLNYVAKTIEGIKINRIFAFPSRIRTFINYILDILNIKNELMYDEQGIINSYKCINQDFKNILIVGLGDAISLIYNLKTNINVHVTIIEGSLEQIKNCDINLSLNQISLNNFSLIHGFVGNKDYIYNAIDRDLIELNVNDFNFDLLELDCEGSEISILQGLVVKPKWIIVELHPMYVEINYLSFMQMMTNKGYLLFRSFNVFGKEVPFQRIPDYFLKKKVKKLERYPRGHDMLVLTFILEEKITLI